MAAIQLQDLIQLGALNEELIAKLVSSDKKDEYFQEICKIGDVELIKLFIKHGADVQSDDNQAIQYTSEYGHLEVVKLLIEHGADVKATRSLALKCASEKGHLEVVKLLIEHGADVNAGNNLAIRYASLNGHLEIVKYLIEQGADVKDDNNQSLKNAVFNKHLEVVKLLIEHGADIEMGLEFNPTGTMKKYLLSLKNQTYYGIVLPSKLDIKLPELMEIIKNNKYYYVYKTIREDEGYTIPNQINRYNILSAFGKVQIFTSI